MNLDIKNRAKLSTNLVNMKMDEFLEQIELESDLGSDSKNRKKRQKRSTDELELILKDNYDLGETPQNSPKESTVTTNTSNHPKSNKVVIEQLSHLVSNKSKSSNYVTEDLEFNKVKVLKIPLSFETVLAFVVIIILTCFGAIYLCKILSRSY